MNWLSVKLNLHRDPDYARDIGAVRCQKSLQTRPAMRSRFRFHPATLAVRVPATMGRPAHAP